MTGIWPAIIMAVEVAVLLSLLESSMMQFKQMRLSFSNTLAGNSDGLS